MASFAPKHSAFNPISINFNVNKHSKDRHLENESSTIINVSNCKVQCKGKLPKVMINFNVTRERKQEIFINNIV